MTSREGRCCALAGGKRCEFDAVSVRIEDVHVLSTGERRMLVIAAVPVIDTVRVDIRNRSGIIVVVDEKRMMKKRRLKVCWAGGIRSDVILNFGEDEQIVARLHKRHDWILIHDRATEHIPIESCRALEIGDRNGDMQKTPGLDIHTIPCGQIKCQIGHLFREFNFLLLRIIKEPKCMLNSSQKAVIVTGAASGLGEAMTLALLHAGFSVCGVGRSEKSLNALAATVRGLGKAEALETIVGNVQSSDDCARCVKIGLERFGRLDALVNNAGATTRPGATALKFFELSDVDWESSMATNVNGAFFMARAITPHLIASGWGRIVNHSTNYGTMTRAGMTPYGPSKAALEAATAAWATELAGTGVTVNAILPGGVANVPRIAVTEYPDREKLVQPAVFGPLIVWLMSDASNAISGRRIVANRWRYDATDEENLRVAAAPAAWG
jgi:NAD(P)-dependent dehydrogenase (short-subunit alcohol dehydrogenase family)